MTLQPTETSLVVRRGVLSDSEFVKRLRNDQLSVRWSRSARGVSDWEHDDWFKVAVTSPRVAMYIAEFRDFPEQSRERVAVVRFDLLVSGDWSVSISLAPEHRGKGLSRQVIELSLQSLCTEIGARIVRVFAEVHEQNAPSMRLFEHSGFRQVSSDGKFRSLMRESR